MLKGAARDRVHLDGSYYGYVFGDCVTVEYQLEDAVSPEEEAKQKAAKGESEDLAEQSQITDTTKASEQTILERIRQAVSWIRPVQHREAQLRPMHHRRMRRRPMHRRLKHRRPMLHRQQRRPLRQPLRRRPRLKLKPRLRRQARMMLIC